MSDQTDPSYPSHLDIDPARWVNDYGDYLYRFALSRVRDQATAQDLVQETFLAALHAADRYSARATERTWLTGILKFKIIDYYRASKREPLIGDLKPEGDPSSTFDDDGHWLIDQPTAPKEWDEKLVAEMDREAFWKHFKACSEKLPEQTRQVFLLREVDDVDSDAICSRLGISAQNFWTIMHRARTALRRCLEATFFSQPTGSGR